MVREEKEQADAIAGRLPPGDIWLGRAGAFRPAEVDNDSELIDALAAFAGAEGDAIDVGAGGGRVALPLARLCRAVVAVEPSAAMRAVLEEEIARRGAGNVRIVADRWETATVEPAELVFASHVTYGVQEIAPFLAKMDRLAVRHAALVAFTDPPQAGLAPFWPPVHGEERLRLPCADELVDVLGELGARPVVVNLPVYPPQPFGRVEGALDELRRRLYVAPGSAADARLQTALPKLTEERDGMLWLRDPRPRERRLIHWRGGSFAATG
jgi:SAM-dependent methyltransferase